MTPDFINPVTWGGGVGLEWAEALKELIRMVHREAFKNVPGGCRWPDEIGPEFLGWHGEM